MKLPQLKKKPSSFDPASVTAWEKGQSVPFLFLALAFDMISKERGRIVITEIVCNMLRTVILVTSEDLIPIVYLSTNRIALTHEGLELGIGDSIIIKALTDTYGGNESCIKTQYQEKGDLSLVAKESQSSSSQSMVVTHYFEKPKPTEALTIRKVFNTLRLIAKESGKGSQGKKKDHIKAILVAATECEPQYLIRLLQVKLRIGYAEQTLLAAIGQAAAYSEEHSRPPPEVQSPLDKASDVVKQVYSVLPDYDKIISALLRSVEFTCEYKYDGERAQIHYLENGKVEIYSRQAERNTGKFPDVVDAVKSLKKRSVSSFILDCEIIAYDCTTRKLLSFRTLTTRACKKVKTEDIKVNVCVFGFDLLYLNDQELLQENLRVWRERSGVIPRHTWTHVTDQGLAGIRAGQRITNLFVMYVTTGVGFSLRHTKPLTLLDKTVSEDGGRRQPGFDTDLNLHLYTSFDEEPGVFQFATALTSNDVEELQNFLYQALGSSCEGLIIKTLNDDAKYEPAKQSHSWLKLKKDYMDNLGDSVDLVPIAAFHGHRKRTGVYGAFLLACYDNNNEEFQSICKIGTGFAESDLVERSSSLRSNVISRPKVWEVRAADLTISPVHRAAAGIVDPKKKQLGEPANDALGTLSLKINQLKKQIQEERIVYIKVRLIPVYAALA
ncbi:hypothetical protein VNO80_26555 [Phaseolus coccineus]|uniref:ATP-dependent DNA ligase family profile domain-containing protein n=1 Tax=Phaseolus coccineus TaxID=3886 RepID=A0AAN9QEI7_PHACN